VAHNHGGRVALVVAAITCLWRPTSASGAPVAYVSSTAGVTVIDRSANSVITTVPIGATTGLGLSPDGATLYAGTWDQQDRFAIVVLSTATNMVRESIAVEGMARWITVAPDGRHLWVEQSRQCSTQVDCVGTDAFRVIDAEDGRSVATLNYDGVPLFGPAVIAPGWGRAYAFTARSTIAVVDTASHTVVGEKLAICCLGPVLALHPDGRHVYALGNEFGGFIGIIDTEDDRDYAPIFFLLGQSFEQLDGQSDIAFTSDGTRAYLPGSLCRAGECSGMLFIVDTTGPQTIETIPLDHFPRRIALAPDDQVAHLANGDADSITVFDLVERRVATTIPLPALPEAVVLAGDATPTSPPTPTPTSPPTPTPTPRRAFTVSVCVPHATAGCGGVVEGGTVLLQPLNRTASGLDGFVFDNVPPGTYTLSHSPRCNPFGCRPPVRITVVDEDVFAQFQLVALDLCPGDCGLDGRVSIEDIIRCVSMAEGGPYECAACDPDSDGLVTIDEILRAVQRALTRCPSTE